MVEDLVQDAKFYQDTLLSCKVLMKICTKGKLNSKVSMINNQSFLRKANPWLLKLQMLKLSRNIKPLLDVQCNKQQEFDQAIEGAVQQYKVQLSTSQSKLQARDW